MKSLQVLLCLSIAAPAAIAQQGATTLAALTQRADVVAQVRALAVDVHHPERCRAVLRPLATLKGTPVSQVFELTEPPGRACGRALFGLLPGRSYVAFLARDAHGGLTLVGGGARALVALEPGLLQHVHALTTAGADALACAISGLDSASARVRDDAAFSLPFVAGLTGASSAQRIRIDAALRDRLNRGERTALPLLQSATRMRLQQSAPFVVDAFLHAKNRSLEPLLCRAAASIDPQSAGIAVTNEWLELAGAEDGATATDRLLALLEELPPNAARAGLLAAMQSSDRKQRIRAGVAWLRKGLAPQELRASVRGDEFATCELCVTDAPTFRSIRPSQKRR